MLDAFGILVAVLPPDQTTRERWVRQWSRALSVAPVTAAHATVDARTTAFGRDADSYDYSLTSRVTLAALEQTVGLRMNLHAAGLADEEGRAIVLIAASGTGKTIAARTLGTRLGYISDETVSVGARFDVLAYPKPLSVAISADQVQGKSQRSPDELGLLPGPAVSTLHRVVILDRSPGAGEPGLRLLPVTEALTLALPQTSFVTSFDSPLLELASILQAGGGPWLLTYDEIADHTDELCELLSAPDEPLETVVHHPGRAIPPHGSPGAYARAPWTDAVQVEDVVVVLVQGNAFHLDFLGATIWLALDRAGDLDRLVAAAEHTHGPHPDAVRLIEEALHSLRRSGIVMIIV